MNGLPIAILRRGYRWHVTLVAAQLNQSPRSCPFVLDTAEGIAADLGISARRVRSALRRLEADRWIATDAEAFGRRRRFWLLWRVARSGRGGDT